MHIRIVHCTVCWGYRDHALMLAEALERRFAAAVEIVDGTLGQFDVVVDGKLISSRGTSLLSRITPPRLPALPDVIAAIERHESLPVGRTPLAATEQERFGPDEARRFYDWFGAWQDAQFYEAAALKDLVAHADFEHASAVLEFGCGTGRLAERLFEEHLSSDARYTGIDLSATMVRMATRRLARWSSRATIERADGTARLAYADGAFDRFVATYVFDLLPQPTVEHVLTEARRVLSANGKLCVASLTEGTTPISRLVSSVWKRLYAFDPRLVGGCRPLRLAASLEATAWKFEHTRVVCSWGICSDIVIASRSI